MFKLFVTLNAMLWWRDLRKVELAAILFYSFFLLVVIGQFMVIVLSLLFAPESEAVQQVYPWVNEDVLIAIHLVFANALWLSQLFFTKLSRLRMQDNRKLLSMGMPVKRLCNYLNLAGFFHPLNMLFHFFWLVYLGFMVSSWFHMMAVVMFIIANYGLIYSFKWRFKVFTSERLKLLNGMFGLILILLIAVAPYYEFPQITADPQATANTVITWLQFSPGALFFFLANNIVSIQALGAAILFLSVLIYLIHIDLYQNTRNALLNPVRNGSSGDAPKSLGRFLSWFGNEGGKYLYYVWHHPYSRTQILMILIIIPYLVYAGEFLMVGPFMTSVLLMLIPMTFMLITTTNIFGFENRELLLSLQAPVEPDTVFRERIYSSIKATLFGIFLVSLFLPVLYNSWLTILQVLLGMFIIVFLFMHYLIKSPVENYKRIEEVSLMSVSNPVVPASISFISISIVFIVGLFVFIVIEPYQWLHVTLLLAVNIVLSFSLFRRIGQESNKLHSSMINRLWNEL